MDADIKDVSKWVFNFLSQDVAGKKIVLLEDEKLRTANVVARVLKRKRSIIKKEQQKAIIAQVKKIYKYLNNPFWQNSLMIERSRVYLDNNLRRMTPSVIKGLTANVEKLEIYFNGVVWDDRILTTDITLKQMAMNFGYSRFGICEKHQQPLVKDVSDDVLCIYTDCSTGKCPFDASKAHGEEIAFLSGLKESLIKMEIVGNKEKEKNGHVSEPFHLPRDR